MREINRFKGNKTIIVITHRVNSLEDCDRILQLKNNTIAAIGTYKDILEIEKNKIK